MLEFLFFVSPDHLSFSHGTREFFYLESHLLHGSSGTSLGGIGDQDSSFSESLIHFLKERHCP